MSSGDDSVLDFEADVFNCQDGPSRGRQKLSLDDFMLADPRLWLVRAALLTTAGAAQGTAQCQGEGAGGTGYGSGSVTTTGRQSGQSSRELGFECSPVPGWDSGAASRCPRLEHHGFTARLC